MSTQPPPCPTWCTGPDMHEVRAREGEPEAEVHKSCLYAGDLLNTRDVNTTQGEAISKLQWLAVMLAEPAMDGHLDLATILLEIYAELRDRDGATTARTTQVHMTPSEARELARTLVLLADLDEADGLASEA